MDFSDVIARRYSCKKYDARPVPEDKLQAVLEAGRTAPTAKNLQEHHIYVLRSPDALGKIDALTPCRYGAGTVLAVTYDRNNVYTYPGGVSSSGAEDATIVATFLMLAAANEGLDSCWLNRFDPAEVKKTLNLPEQEEVLMLLDLGYAAPEAGPLPNHFKRKELTETVTYL